MTKPGWIGLATFAMVVGSAATGQRTEHHQEPGDHPDYKVEIEPHLDLRLGEPLLRLERVRRRLARFAIPIVQNGFVPSINNSVAISFGARLPALQRLLLRRGVFDRQRLRLRRELLDLPRRDAVELLAHAALERLRRAGPLHLPRRLRRHSAATTRGSGTACEPVATGVDFAAYAGGRFHFNDTVALTLRLGYPTLSFGVSFLL